MVQGPLRGRVNQVRETLKCQFQQIKCTPSNAPDLGNSPQPPWRCCGALYHERISKWRILKIAGPNAWHSPFACNRCFRSIRWVDWTVTKRNSLHFVKFLTVVNNVAFNKIHYCSWTIRLGYVNKMWRQWNYNKPEFRLGHYTSFFAYVWERSVRICLKCVDVAFTSACHCF